MGQEQNSIEKRRLLTKAKDQFIRSIVDEILPALTVYGDQDEGIHHRDIPYHEHEGIQMHLDVYAPDAPGPHPVLVSYHGGGWMFGLRTNLQRCGKYLARQGFVVFNVSYRLAPAHAFPTAMQDALCALRWVYDHAAEYGGDPEQIGVWGDSAGGHLSAMMAVGQHTPFVQPKCQCNKSATVKVNAAAHFYGIFDMARFSRLHFPFIRGIAHAVFGDKQNDPEFMRAMSPEALATAGNIPPTLLLCGTRDPLLGETRNYAKRLRRLGGTVETRIFRNALHGFLYFWWSSEFETALHYAAEHFKKHLSHAADSEDAA